MTIEPKPVNPWVREILGRNVSVVVTKARGSLQSRDKPRRRCVLLREGAGEEAQRAAELRCGEPDAWVGTRSASPTAATAARVTARP
jgi:hypothetical protein